MAMQEKRRQAEVKM